MNKNENENKDKNDEDENEREHKKDGSSPNALRVSAWAVPLSAALNIFSASVCLPLNKEKAFIKSIKK